VSFDVGGTLLEPWPSVGHVYGEVGARHGLPPLDPEALSRQFRAVWRGRAGFDYSPAAWRGVVEETFAGLSVGPISADCFLAIYSEFARTERWRIFSDVAPCLLALREQGLRLAVISNWDERLRPLLQGLGLEGWFERIVVSHEVGRCKPDSALFCHAAEGLGLHPAQVLHVGDSREEDVRGAETAGMQALLLDRGDAPEEGTLGTLAELPGWCRGRRAGD
jgi:putative hydrolase of the HAD superfamily